MAARNGVNRYPIYNWKENPDVTAARWADPSGLQNFSEGEEPMYGTQYLPRKFKISITVPSDNSVDIYVDDVNLVVIMDENDPTQVKGYNVLVGGGMGRAHNNEETYAYSAEHLGFVPREHIYNVVKSITCVQRDYGRRDDRKMSRFKYVVAEKGIDWIREQVERYSTVKIEPWVPLPPWKYEHHLGWHEQGDGKLFLGLNIENGRIKDEGSFRMKAALREIVERYNTPVLITPQQNIIISEIDPVHKVHIEHVLDVNGVKHKLAEIGDLTLNHMACPALPMCGLATTEAERISGDLVGLIDRARKAASVPDLDLVTRITGCPNGCARTYMAEIGFVGSGPN